jgi:hypothetical protein
MSRHAGPSRSRIGDAGQGVHNRVEIGRDGEAEVLEVVGRVDDHIERIGRQLVGEAERELRAADATGEGEDPVVSH